MSREYDKGDLVRCSAIFTDAAGTFIDPTTVTAKTKNPAATTTTYVYGTDVALVRDSAGHYHIDVSVSTTGTWRYRFESTGTGQAAAEGVFIVKSDF